MVVEPQTRQHQPQVVALPRRYTVADYNLLPDDGPRYELINGVLIEVPSPLPIHQRVLRRLVLTLGAIMEHEGSGEFFFAPFDVELPGDVIVQPDLLFVSDARQDRVSDRRMVGAPDLVVEISSRSTRDRDLWSKRDAYLAAGVREYWFVDVDEQTIIVWEARDGDWSPLAADERGHARSTVLPRLTVDPTRLFAEGRT
jgi:Uma2 family endonuclease